MTFAGQLPGCGSGCQPVERRSVGESEPWVDSSRPERALENSVPARKDRRHLTCGQALRLCLAQMLEKDLARHQRICRLHRA